MTTGDGWIAQGASRLASALSDRYHLDRELGRGGMATVFLALGLTPVAAWRSWRASRWSTARWWWNPVSATGIGRVT